MAVELAGTPVASNSLFRLGRITTVDWKPEVPQVRVMGNVQVTRVTRRQRMPHERVSDRYLCGAPSGGQGPS
jgi:hypothetical protein